MLIMILKDTETPTHSLKKGQLVNVQSASAAILVASKLARIPTKKDLGSKDVD